MARRMFSPVVVESDAFLDMPVSSQALYFHLGMHTDDDGFVNPKRIMRMMQAADNDLDVLLAKGFVIRFKSGVVVITDWKRNNLIRKDWYKPTIYQDEKAQLGSVNSRYILVNEMSPKLLTEYRKGENKENRGELSESDQMAAIKEKVKNALDS